MILTDFHSYAMEDPTTRSEASAFEHVRADTDVRITIADVALRANVSKTTVSRVLNGKSDLDVGTAARVRQVIEFAA